MGPRERGPQGFAFVVQNFDPETALDTEGGSVGYDGIPNSVAVEFDPSFDMWAGDRDDNHISVHTEGHNPNNVRELSSIGSATPVGVDMGDGAPHTARIEYVPGTLEVYLDDDASPALQVSLNLGDLLTLEEGKAWVGFTSSGFTPHSAAQDILSWTFSPTLPPPSASFSGDVESGTVPLEVGFANKTLGQFSSVEWGFGDGATSTESSPTHTYTTAGTHTVTMTVSAPDGSDTVVMTDLITVEPGPLASIVVEPAQVTMDIGASQQFAFTAVDEFGNRVTDVGATWTVPAELGSIDANGVLTVGTMAGDYPGGVTVEVAQGSVTASATADVIVRPDPLATVELQPAEVVLDPEDQQQFTATGRDQYGNDLKDVEFAWASTGGEIDQTGFFAATGPGGRYMVVVTANVGSNTTIASANVDVLPNWVQIGDMLNRRSSHTSTLLPGGKVLIVRGAVPAEVYDPSVDAFESIGNPLCGHGGNAQATMLDNDSVLITGGVDDPTCALL